MTCVKCIVSGRVQGVYYRGATQKQAGELGVVGYAKNLSNGCVEVLMCGEFTVLESLQSWLWQGPQYAEVHNINCTQIDIVDLPTSFNTY